MTNDLPVGNKIRNARCAAGISLQAMAYQANMQTRRLWQIEDGSRWDIKKMSWEPVAPMAGELRALRAALRRVTAGQSIAPAVRQATITPLGAWWVLRSVLRFIAPGGELLTAQAGTRVQETKQLNNHEQRALKQAKSAVAVTWAGQVRIIDEQDLLKAT